MVREEHGYDPYLYQITHRGNPGDVSFYTSACRNQTDILELGCGTGRMLVPLAEAGFQLTGIDVHQGMLDQLQNACNANANIEHPVQLTCQDIRSFSLEKQFDRILMPYNLLFCLLSKEDIISCLHNVARHLKPGGACIFDVYQADDEILETYLPEETQISLGPAHTPEEDDEEEWEPNTIVYDGDTQIRIDEKRFWEPQTKRIDAAYRYRFANAGEMTWYEEKIFHIPQIYLHAHEIRELFSEADLMWTQTYGHFRGQPLTDDSEHLIVWAKKIPR